MSPRKRMFTQILESFEKRGSKSTQANKDVIPLGDIETSDVLGLNLHKEAQKGSRRSLKKLLKTGIYVDYPNDLGQTPLYCACAKDNEATATLLLQEGANPNEKCHKGMTPSHVCCFVGNIYILGKIIEAGGDLRLHDNEGKGMRDWALACQDGKRKMKMLEFLDKTHIHAMTYCGDTISLDRFQQYARRSTKQTSLMEIMRARTGSDTIVDHACSVQSLGFGKVYLGGHSGAGLVSVIPLVSENVLYVVGFRVFESGYNTFMEHMEWQRTPVTVKQVKTDVALDDGIDILITDAEYLGKLRHPNILLLMGICQPNSLENLMLVCERVDKGSIFDHVYIQKQSLDRFMKLTVIEQVLGALEFIYSQGLIHCGLSSKAIYIANHFTAKVGNLEYMVEAAKADMGKLSPVSNVSHRGYLYNWMAPELMEGLSPTVKVDIYSFSVLALELFTGELPWAGYEPDEIYRSVVEQGIGLQVTGHIPSKLKALIGYGLELKPSDRLQSFDNILQWYKSSKIFDFRSLVHAVSGIRGEAKNNSSNSYHDELSTSRSSLASTSTSEASWTLESETGWSLDKLDFGKGDIGKSLPLNRCQSELGGRSVLIKLSDRLNAGSSVASDQKLPTQIKRSSSCGDLTNPKFEGNLGKQKINKTLSRQHFSSSTLGDLAKVAKHESMPKKLKKSETFPSPATHYRSCSLPVKPASHCACPPTKVPPHPPHGDGLFYFCGMNNNGRLGHSTTGGTATLPPSFSSQPQLCPKKKPGLLPAPCVRRLALSFQQQIQQHKLRQAILKGSMAPRGKSSDADTSLDSPQLTRLDSPNGKALFKDSHQKTGSKTSIKENSNEQLETCKLSNTETDLELKSLVHRRGRVVRDVAVGVCKDDSRLLDENEANGSFVPEIRAKLEMDTMEKYKLTFPDIVTELKAVQIQRQQRRVSWDGSLGSPGGVYYHSPTVEVHFHPMTLNASSPFVLKESQTDTFARPLVQCQKSSQNKDGTGFKSPDPSTDFPGLSSSTPRGDSFWDVETNDHNLVDEDEERENNGDFSTRERTGVDQSLLTYCSVPKDIELCDDNNSKQDAVDGDATTSVGGGDYNNAEAVGGDDVEDDPIAVDVSDGGGDDYDEVDGSKREEPDLNSTYTVPEGSPDLTQVTEIQTNNESVSQTPLSENVEKWIDYKLDKIHVKMHDREISHGVKSDCSSVELLEMRDISVASSFTFTENSTLNETPGITFPKECGQEDPHESLSTTNVLKLDSALSVQEPAGCDFEFHEFYIDDDFESAERLHPDCPPKILDCNVSTRESDPQNTAESLTVKQKALLLFEMNPSHKPPCFPKKLKFFQSYAAGCPNNLCQSAFSNTSDQGEEVPRDTGSAEEVKVRENTISHSLRSSSKVKEKKSFKSKAKKVNGRYSHSEPNCSLRHSEFGERFIASFSCEVTYPGSDPTCSQSFQEKRPSSECVRSRHNIARNISEESLEEDDTMHQVAQASELEETFTIQDEQAQLSSKSQEEQSIDCADCPLTSSDSQNQCYKSKANSTGDIQEPNYNNRKDCEGREKRSDGRSNEVSNNTRDSAQNLRCTGLSMSKDTIKKTSAYLLESEIHRTESTTQRENFRSMSASSGLNSRASCIKKTTSEMAKGSFLSQSESSVKSVDTGMTRDTSHTIATYSPFRRHEYTQTNRKDSGSDSDSLGSDQWIKRNLKQIRAKIARRKSRPHYIASSDEEEGTLDNEQVSMGTFFNYEKILMGSDCPCTDEFGVDFSNIIEEDTRKQNSRYENAVDGEAKKDSYVTEEMEVEANLLEKDEERIDCGELLKRISVRERYKDVLRQIRQRNAPLSSSRASVGGRQGHVTSHFQDSSFTDSRTRQWSGHQTEKGPRHNHLHSGEDNSKSGVAQSPISSPTRRNSTSYTADIGQRHHSLHPVKENYEHSDSRSPPCNPTRRNSTAYDLDIGLGRNSIHSVEGNHQSPVAWSTTYSPTRRKSTAYAWAVKQRHDSLHSREGIHQSSVSRSPAYSYTRRNSTSYPRDVDCSKFGNSPRLSVKDRENPVWYSPMHKAKVDQLDYEGIGINRSHSTLSNKPVPKPRSIMTPSPTSRLSDRGARMSTSHISKSTHKTISFAEVEDQDKAKDKIWSTPEKSGKGSGLNAGRKSTPYYGHNLPKEQIEEVKDVQTWLEKQAFLDNVSLDKFSLTSLDRKQNDHLSLQNFRLMSDRDEDTRSQQIAGIEDEKEIDMTLKRSHAQGLEVSDNPKDFSTPKTHKGNSVKISSGSRHSQGSNIRGNIEDYRQKDNGGDNDVGGERAVEEIEPTQPDHCISVQLKASGSKSKNKTGNGVHKFYIPRDRWSGSCQARVNIHLDPEDPLVHRVTGTASDPISGQEEIFLEEVFCTENLKTSLRLE